MNPKLILFDIGGVLINYQNSFKTASEEQKIPVEKIWNEFLSKEEEITSGDITPQELYTNATKDLKVDREYGFADSWVKDYTPVKPTYDLLIQLSKKYDIGLLSNIYKDIVPKILEEGKLPKVNYAYKFISCDIGLSKPNEDIYLYVEDITGLKPEEIFFIDDREDFLEVPKVRGWNTYLFDKEDPQKSVDEIEQAIG